MKSKKEKIIQITGGQESNPNPILLTSYGRVIMAIISTQGTTYIATWKDITPKLEEIK